MVAAWINVVAAWITCGCSLDHICLQAHANELPLFDQQTSDRAGGDPNIRYYHSYWRLPAGMALRIRVRPPPCRCWNFQLNS